MLVVICFLIIIFGLIAMWDTNDPKKFYLIWLLVLVAAAILQAM